MASVAARPPAIAAKPKLVYKIHLLTPNPLIDNESGTCIIIFNLPLPTGVDISVKFSSITKSTFVGAERINATTLSFIGPTNFPNGEAKVSIHTGIEQTLLCEYNERFELKSQVDYVHTLLESTLDPILFMSSIFGKNEKDLDAVDTKLESMFKMKLPDNLMTLKGSQVCLDPLVNQQRSLLLNPTLLHFAARYNLVKLCTALLDCPGAQEALQIYNSEGFVPSTLATRFGYIGLSKMLEVDMEQVYECMSSYLDSSPEMVNDLCTRTDSDAYGEEDDYTYMAIKQNCGQPANGYASVKNLTEDMNNALNIRDSNSIFLKQQIDKPSPNSTPICNKKNNPPKKAHSFDMHEMHGNLSNSLHIQHSLPNIKLQDKSGISEAYELQDDEDDYIDLSLSNQESNNNRVHGNIKSVFDDPTFIHTDGKEDTYDVPPNFQNKEYVCSEENTTNIYDVPPIRDPSTTTHPNKYKMSPNHYDQSMHDVLPQSHGELSDPNSQDIYHIPPRCPINTNNVYVPSKNNKEIYDVPPNYTPPVKRRDIYDVPPMKDGKIINVPPVTGSDIYDVPPVKGSEIYDVPPVKGSMYNKHPSRCYTTTPHSKPLPLFPSSSNDQYCNIPGQFTSCKSINSKQQVSTNSIMKSERHGKPMPTPPKQPLFTQPTECNEVLPMIPPREKTVPLSKPAKPKSRLRKQ